MKITAHPQVILMLFSSPLLSFYLCVSLATESKTNATITGKRKKKQNDENTNRYLSMSLSNVARRWKEEGYLHHPLAIKHLTYATKPVSWELFYSYWRERSIQEGFHPEKLLLLEKNYFSIYYSRKKLVKPGASGSTLWIGPKIIA